ncbi:MAG TPA: N-acetyltransferase [Pyrinomonadaceae bacterium]|nr:N-acetyltransferase [Pyrinomonadaceae bacterium]
MHSSAPAAPGVRAQANVAAQPKGAAIQTRGALPRVAANRPGAALNQHGPNRPTAAATPRAPNYNVQPPIHLGGRSQQIRATIQGTPQVAGSVEISAIGPGKAYISNLKVDQQHRRRGVAAKLIDAAINTARRQGFSAASLEARPSDNGITPQTLVAMYRRKGFKSVGKSQRGSALMERKL